MSVTSAAGFEAGGLACGIKPGGASDLAMVATTSRAPATAAGVFTTNRVQAAPVQISHEHLRDGRAVAVILNSGNANAATGAKGRNDALRMCALTAQALGCATDDVLVCSTGLIGIPMIMSPIESGVPALAGALSADAPGASAAADAILTTDTVRKEATVRIELSGARVATIGGMAKGAAMLEPAMATMLSVVTTDVAIDAEALREALGLAVQGSFNEISVDGCMSTNDTVLVLANGVAGNAALTRQDPDFAVFAEGLGAVCRSLAEQMISDAEGATKRARITISGARTHDDARRAARQVATSQLVQCSLYGSDPYWGRVLSEVGASGAEFDPEQVHITYNGIRVCEHGVAATHDVEALARSMQGRDIDISCDLHAGDEQASILFSDLTHAYVDENLGTS